MLSSRIPKGWRKLMTTRPNAHEYVVVIGDPVHMDSVSPGQPFPEARSVFWQGTAESPEAAGSAALEAAAVSWPEKYRDALPADPMITTQPGPKVCRACEGRGWVSLPSGRHRCTPCDGDGRRR